MVLLGRLRFRRHLLVCLFVALLGETLRLASEQGELHAGQRRRPTRVRVASAQELADSGHYNVQAIYRHDTHDDDHPGLWSRLATRLRRLVPVINLNYSILNTPDKFSESGSLDAQIDAYYDEKLPADTRLDELQLLSVRAADRMAPTPLHISWGYASRRMALEGSQPVGDAQLCSLQLAHLVRRLDQALKEAPMDETAARGQPTAGGVGGGPVQVASPVDNFEARQMYRTADLELMRYLDTFGKVPSEMLRGNTRWYGAYESCLKTRLKPSRSSSQADLANAATPKPHHANNQERNAIKFRYCMGAYKSLAWPKTTTTTSLGNEQTAATSIAANRSRSQLEHFIRIGLCLPEACDSNALELNGNWRSLERLVKFNLAKPFNSDHYKLEQLYCVPDERSPLRRIPAGGWLLLCLAGCWLLLVAGATFVQLNVDKFYLKTVERIRREQKRRAELAFEPSSSSALPQNLKTDERNDSAGVQDEHEELGEKDILNVKLNVIKLNVYIRDKSRRIVPGVDLIDCLSLYGNWQRYTRRLKAAIVSEQRELERDRQLVERNDADDEGGGGGEAPNNKAVGLASKLGLAGAQVVDGRGSAGATSEPDPSARRGERAERESRGEFSAGHHHSVGAHLNRVDTSSLNALKVVALAWIIAGHCILYLASAISNGANLRDVLPTLGVYALIGGALYITELFFIITGCLTAYLLFRRSTRLVARRELEIGGEPASERLEMRLAGSRADGADSKRHRKQQQQQQQRGGPQPQHVAFMDGRLLGPASLPYYSMMVVNRYLRILPTYLLVFAFIKLVNVYVGGEGHLWDYAVGENSIRRACVQESWWPVLTLTSNFRDIYKHCIVGGWYLSADMQFAIVSVPLVWLLAHSQSAGNVRPSGGSPRPVRNGKSAAPARPGRASSLMVAVEASRRRVASAYALVFCLGLISVGLAIINTWLYSPVDFAYLVKFSPHSIAMMSQNILMYTNSVFRVRAFAAGLLLGHLLYLYEFKLLKLPQIIQFHGSKLTLTILTLGFLIMFMPVLLHGKLVASHDVAAMLTVLNAGAIDLFLSLLLFLICIGKAPKAVLFCLNSPMWSLLSSLSLSAFLIHSEIIIMLTSRLDPPPSVSYALIALVLSATLLATYSLALALYLTFEMPISRLILALTMAAGGGGGGGQRGQAKQRQPARNQT